MIIKVDEIVCNVLIVLLLIYFCQGALYPQGSIISQLALGLLFILSLPYPFKVILDKDLDVEHFVLIWLIFLLINIFSFLFKGEYTTVYIDKLKDVLINMLPFFAFYYFTKMGVLKRKHLFLVFWILLPITIMKFSNSISELRQIKGNEINMVSNSSYLFLGLIPFVFLFKRKLFSYLSLSLIFIFLLQSLKRASIIGGLIGFILLFYVQFKSGNGPFKGLYYFGSILLVLIITYFGYNYIIEHESVVYRFQAMLSGDSSGRDYLVNNALAHWYHSDSYFTYIFGDGFVSTINIIGGSAHNDFVEALVSFGLIGLFVYVSIFYFGIKEFFNEDRSLNNKNTLIYILFIGLLTSFTSRWYTSSFGYSQMLLLPYIIANYKLDNE